MFNNIKKSFIELCCPRPYKTMKEITQANTSGIVQLTWLKEIRHVVPLDFGVDKESAKIL